MALFTILDLSLAAHIYFLSLLAFEYDMSYAYVVKVRLRKIFRATNGFMNRLGGHKTTHPLVFHYIRAQDTNFLVRILITFVNRVMRVIRSKLINREVFSLGKSQSPTKNMLKEKRKFQSRDQ